MVPGSRPETGGGGQPRKLSGEQRGFLRGAPGLVLKDEWELAGGERELAGTSLAA